jgi:tRNA A-37 threonylcarbamoyl transferase component Bud32
LGIIENVRNYFDKKGNKALGLTGKTEISVLGKGESNLNLLARNSEKEFVVRVSLLEKSRTRREYNILKAIEPLHIAPRPYVIDESKRFVKEDFIIIEKLPGMLLNKRISADDVKIIAKTLLKLHHKKYTGFGQVDGNLKRGILYDSLNERIGWVSYELNNLRDEIIRNNKPADLRRSILPVLIKMKRTFDDICLKNRQFFSGSHFSVVHGDLRQWNILRYPGGISLIDWELARIADPAEDIANFFVNSYISGSGKKIFMKEYLGGRTDKSLEKRVRVYELLQMMGIAYWFGKKYYYSKANRLHRELNPTGKDKEYRGYFFHFISGFIKKSGLDPRMTSSRARRLGRL